MNLPRRLTPEESDALNAVLQKLSARARHTLTLSGLLQRWQDFVLQIEQGYQDSIYEYTNDLSVRDLLEEVLKEVPQTLQKELTQLIRPWDARFDNATKKTRRPVLPHIGQESLSWWWFRVPKHLGEELEADLRSLVEDSVRRAWR